jgi:hypothetical protein
MLRSGIVKYWQARLIESVNQTRKGKFLPGQEIEDLK